MRDFDPTASEFISSGYLASSRPGGRMYDPGTLLSAGASLVGGLLGSDASEDAAAMQAQSAREATAAQERMFERQVQLQKPWYDQGGRAINSLSYLMGLDPTGGGGVEAEDAIRARLTPQFTRAPAAGGATSGFMSVYGLPTTMPKPPEYEFVQVDFQDGNPVYAYVPAQPTQPASSVDDAGLNAAVQAEITRQKDLAGTNASRDPRFGSLTREFGRKDFEVDPGYGFRQEEGAKALERQASAGGRLWSGRAMKDMQRFSQGLASDEYGRAFDRFNVNKSNQFNRLASLAGVGQTSAQQTGAAASRFGEQMGANIIGAGNAAAAGRVGSANAWNNAIGQGTSIYQTNRMMDLINKPQATYGGAGLTGGGGFGTGAAFGNQDYGQYF